MANSSAWLAYLCTISLGATIALSLYLYATLSGRKPRQTRQTRRDTVWRCADCGSYNSNDSEYCSECGRFYYEDIDQFFDVEEDEF